MTKKVVEESPKVEQKSEKRPEEDRSKSKEKDRQREKKEKDRQREKEKQRDEQKREKEKVGDDIKLFFALSPTIRTNKLGCL